MMTDVHMKKSRKPIEWCVGVILLILGIVMSVIRSNTYEMPTWFRITQILALTIAGALLIFTSLKTRKTRKQERRAKVNI
jgi:protein-S-isoprenylcysteine O-methyltransferase Ste14